MGPLEVWPQEHVGVLGKAQQGAAGVAGGKAAKVVCELPGKKTSVSRARKLSVRVVATEGTQRGNE